MELSKYIKEVLLTKDNVIIPNFGAFEKTMVSASIDENTGEMTPPHAAVVFKPELNVDRGVLVKHIAQKENLAEDKVREEIEKQVQEWHSSLNSGKNVIIQGIGMLHKDASGTIAFQSAVKPSDFPESYGLPVITVTEKSATALKKEPEKPGKIPEKKQVKKKTPPAKKTVKQKAVSETTGDKKSHKKLIVGLIIGVPLVILIVLGALNFEFVKQKFSDITGYVSSLFSGDNESDTTNIPKVVNIDTLSAKDSIDLETETQLQNYNIVDAQTNDKIEPKMEHLSSVKKVYIIAGSFQIKKSAQNHRNKLNRKGFKAEVLPLNKGLYRVSVGSFDNIETATKEMERIKSIDDNLSVWILVSK